MINNFHIYIKNISRNGYVRLLLLTDDSWKYGFRSKLYTVQHLCKLKNIEETAGSWRADFASCLIGNLFWSSRYMIQVKSEESSLKQSLQSVYLFYRQHLIAVRPPEGKTLEQGASSAPDSK